MRTLAGGAALLILAGCQHGGSLPSVDKALVGVDQLTPDAFPFCSDHGCEVQQQVSLTPEEWSGIVAPLAEPAPDAAAERQAVAAAVGRFETAVARQAGTGVDRGGTMTFPGRRQLDCVDESVNTTRFLTMLDKQGLLHFHIRGRPVHRAFAGGFSHMTATLREEGGGSWAIDSWFSDSGEPAEVVALDVWLAGYNPPWFGN